MQPETRTVQQAQKRLGEWLLDGGHITPAQLEQAVREKERRPKVPFGQVCVELGFLTLEELDHLLTRYGKRLPLGEMLVREGLISETQLREALAKQHREGGRVGEILLRLGMVKEDELYELLARQYNLPFLPLKNMHPDPQLSKVINRSYAAQNRVVPISLLGRRLTVALCDPARRGCAEDLRRATGLEIAPILSTPSDVEAYHGALYGQSTQDSGTVRSKGREHEREQNRDQTREREPSAVTEACLTMPDPPPPADVVDRPQSSRGPVSSDLDLEVLEEEEVDFRKSRYVVHVEDSPVVQRLVQSIIVRALALKASDIHLEVDVTGPRLRFRVDGLLAEHSLGGDQDEHYRANYRSIISRIKILGQMDITEKRRPQDASFRMIARRKGQVTTVDLRLSSLPGRFGEGMVIRLLDQLKAPRSLDSLGFSPEVQVAFEAIIKRTQGIILITGPTGSGKSSTLYAALRTIHRPELKIMTVEDPIEFTHVGIVQTEVNPIIENTFARFLRAFLRQDPDVIMVGEIRDGETAEMAMRAAQTGHLLLSTLHTINATASIQRLLDLYDDPNSLSTALIGIMAQRLVRMICPSCAEEYEPDAALLLEWFSEPPRDVHWMRGRGCPSCHNSGYSGRAAVAELWVPSAYEMTLINRRASGEEIRREALRRMSSLGEDALLKAMQGTTTLEEALRVAPFEDVQFLKSNGALPVRRLTQRTTAMGVGEMPPIKELPRAA